MVSIEPAMRIVFMGTPAFAVPTLQHLLDSEYSVVGVVCQPDRPSGRGKRLQVGPVKVLAMEQGLPVLQPEKMKDPMFLETLRGWKPDAIVVAAFGRILPKIILNLPPKGCLNVHGSLLPKYRGAAPIQWAVINGEAATGITIMLMDEGMDTGAILQQEVIPIGSEETAGELASRMAQVGGKLLGATLTSWFKGQLTPYPQNDDEATLAPILKKEDGLISWELPSSQIANRIRGLSPWPGGYTFLQGERLGIWKVKIKDMETTSEDSRSDKMAIPGTITSVTKQTLDVQTGQGILSILEIQPENRKRMNIGEYIAGHRIEGGMRFSDSKNEKTGESLS